MNTTIVTSEGLSDSTPASLSCPSQGEYEVIVAYLDF